MFSILISTADNVTVVDETTVSKQARVLNVMTEFAHSGLDKLKSGDVKNNLKSLVST